ncbi:GGDEF domain-containing protein [Desulfoscipio geothermicus]|uniref:GGDEF domain-containing protein n=1 Tax=Desulfoscipio geothermicus TaxID=39060 RepID=UPI002481F3A4|nr:GGDEF domain-containing protein [Desulfoscipio geothermicus]
MNDNCGHACGDLVLSDVAKLIKTTARVSDVVGRYGGDEFVVILSNTDEDAALSFARRVIEKVNKHSFITPLGRLEIGVSLGVSVWQPDNGNGNLEERMRVLLQQADMALLESKRQGRNRATIGGKHAR